MHDIHTRLCHVLPFQKEELSDDGKVTSLEWTGNSPSLNRMDELGNYEKKFADKQPSSTNALVDAIEKAWIKEISVQYFLTSLPACRATPTHTKH